MGCFLGCFGASKDERKRNKHAQITNSSHSYTIVGNQYNPMPQNVGGNQKILVTRPVFESGVKSEEGQLSVHKQDKHEQLSLDKLQEQSSSGKPEERLSLGKLEEELSLGKPEEKSSPSPRKKVTFDSNVKEYEHVSFDEAPDIIQEFENGSDKGVDAKCSEQGKFSLISDSGSSLSSSGSFPHNHRYQNCRESDDEDDELVCEISDLDESEDGSDEEGEGYEAEYCDDEYHPRQLQEFSTRSCFSVESGTRSSMSHQANDRHRNEPIQNGGSPNKEESTPPGFYYGARDRARYVHSVLNPVENTDHWKAVKAKGPPLLKQQKENIHMHVGFEQSSSKCKLKFVEPENSHEVAVDASLSTWLVTSQKTPPRKAAPFGLEPVASEASVSSHGSNSVMQYSASNSPRRSPGRSPNEKPILGTVGVHWNSGSSRTPIEDSGSASSFKGIPNTTSKYREDKRVNWHSTPFETRLERALDRGASDSRA